MKQHYRAFLFLSLAYGAMTLSAQDPPPQPLSLENAEAILLKRSQTIAASRYQLEVSEALRRIAGYKPNPTLHVGMEQIPFQSPIAGSAPRFFATNPDAGANPVYTSQVTKVIERGGKRELRVQQADAVVEASRAQILDSFRTQLFQLRQAFTSALLARENLRIAQTIDAQYQETERLIDLRFKSGDVAAVDVFRAQAARLPYRQAVLDAQAQYQQSLRDILNALDMRPGSALEIEGQFATKPVTQPLEELRQIALTQRPDVRAALNTLRAAQRGSALALAQRTRDVSLGFEYQRVGEDNTAGVTAEIPLFLYNNQKAAAAQAAAQERVAQAQLRQTETQAVTDVEKAYQTLLAAQRSLEVYKGEGLAATEKVRSVIQFSFQRGEASLFELLDAQRTASQAAIAANQARAAYALAIWQIEQAIGQPLPQ